MMGTVRKAVLEANDKSSRVKVTMAFDSGTLNADEVWVCVKSLIRGICDVLEHNVPYSDFGPENIKITL